jgi:hypothetical protein
MISGDDLIHIVGVVNAKKFEVFIVRNDLPDVCGLLRHFDIIAARHDLDILIPWYPKTGPGRNFRNFTEKRRMVLLLLLEKQMKHPQEPHVFSKPIGFV